MLVMLHYSFIFRKSIRYIYLRAIIFPILLSLIYLSYYSYLLFIPCKIFSLELLSCSSSAMSQFSQILRRRRGQSTSQHCGTDSTYIMTTARAHITTVLWPTWWQVFGHFLFGHFFFQRSVHHHLLHDNVDISSNTNHSRCKILSWLFYTSILRKSFLFIPLQGFIITITSQWFSILFHYLGQWYSRVCGLPPVLPHEMALSCYQTIHRLNVLTFGGGKLLGN